MTKTQSDSDRKAILSLWYSWIISSGAITAVAVLSLWLTRIWLPIIAFTLSVVLYVMVRRNDVSANSRCYVVPNVMSGVLSVSGLIMTVIDVLNTPFLITEPWIHSRTGVVPYMGALVCYPVAAVAFVFASTRRFRLHHCQVCRFRNGMPAERGIIGMFYSQEGIFQRHLMATTSVGLTVVLWIYYLTTYINVSLSRADIYMFFVIPAVMFVCMGVYMGLRYLSIFYYYDRDIAGALPSWSNSTIVRYIIICGNKILLHVPDRDNDSISFSEKIDTPAVLRFSYRRQIDPYDARNWFFNLNHISMNSEMRERVEVRFMYSGNSASAQSNLFHYLVFASQPEDVEGDSIKGEWFNIYEIQELIRQGKCNSLLAAELNRLHTIAMAWKTYDRRGFRLYKIKNYVPSFRVSDIRKWDVDYNDPHWLYVASNNESRPLFRLRRLWRKYITGINDQF